MYDHLSVSQAIRIQEDLKNKLLIRPLPADIKSVGGADIAFNRNGDIVYACIVILQYPSLKPVAHSLASAKTNFPCISGLLPFREIPALLKAWQQLPEKPDILIIDGHGIAHPRNMGLASHFGTLTGQITIGCSGKPAMGQYRDPSPIATHSSFLYDDKIPVGAVLRTKNHTKPVFVSPGNKADIKSSLQLIKQCTGGQYRIPDPTRMAQSVAGLFRNGLVEEGYHCTSLENFS